MDVKNIFLPKSYPSFIHRTLSAQYTFLSSAFLSFTLTFLSNFITL